MDQCGQNLLIKVPLFCTILSRDKYSEEALQSTVWFPMGMILAQTFGFSVHFYRNGIQITANYDIEM